MYNCHSISVYLIIVWINRSSAMKKKCTQSSCRRIFNTDHSFRIYSRDKVVSCCPYCGKEYARIIVSWAKLLNSPELDNSRIPTMKKISKAAGKKSAVFVYKMLREAGII